MQASGSLRLAGAGALASESQHMGATPAGARDATRRLFARTLSWTQAINLRSETRLAVTGAITPLKVAEEAEVQSARHDHILRVCTVLGKAS